MTMEVNGKVVRIISKSEVIIDIGRDAHVEVGDKVEIIVVGDKITDDSGRSLGYFTFQKDSLEVTHTEPSFAVAQKIHVEHASGPYANLFSQMSKSLTQIYGTSTTSKTPRDLDIQEDEIKPLAQTTLEDKTIHVGDQVRVFTS
ncbi:hypothetical protein FAM18126_00948 [Lacticaseibacillus paracasei]|uniref:hypothetical protein n=1 Tax=Lacticaseibacillus paracasei TaxID=1597 RepID=UPI000FF67762|nr:hypothetical protein [Lacticaseibacillus paracasei]RND67120.1 hypothetical protein FAM18126_00948 [Lacticaseibacillus paracasei]